MREMKISAKKSAKVVAPARTLPGHKNTIVAARAKSKRRNDKSLPAGMLARLRREAKAHWDSGNGPYTYWEATCRESGGFTVFFDGLVAQFLKKIPAGHKVKIAHVEIREPMPYETWIGDELLKEGTADGFVGIEGEASRKRSGVTEVFLVFSRQIGKPFYQYIGKPR